MGNTTSCCVSSSPKLRRNAHSRLESCRPDADLSREDTGCNLQHISDRENIDARLEDARLRARRSHSAASDLLRSQQNERDRMRVAERHHRKTADRRQTLLHVQQSRYYNRLAFRYNPADDYYSLSRHVLIGTVTKVCPYSKALKFNGETKGMCCAARKIKLPQLGEPPDSLKILLARYTTESKHFLYNIRK